MQAWKGQYVSVRMRKNSDRSKARRTSKNRKSNICVNEAIYERSDKVTGNDNNNHGAKVVITMLINGELEGTFPGVQGNDGRLPGWTSAGQQNPDTFASSELLLDGLSVPWENDRPWG